MSDVANCNGETLCWRCTRPGTGTCSWDRNLTPVPGWSATAEPWRLQKAGTYGMTWHVHACPLFQEDLDYLDRMAHASTSAAGARKRGRTKTQDWERMHWMFRNHFADKTVAREFGIAISTVRHYRVKWRKEFYKQKGRPKK